MGTNRSHYSYFHRLRVRYSEIDAQAIVYNSHYVTYYDLTITEYLRALGIDYSIAATKEQGKDFHTVRVVVDYSAPARYDDLLDIGIRAGRIGRSSITWQMAIFRSGEEESLNTGEVIWVYTDQQTHKSTALPEELIKKLTERDHAQSNNRTQHQRDAAQAGI